MIVLAVRYDWPSLSVLAKHGGGIRSLAKWAASTGEERVLRHLHDALRINVGTIQDDAGELLLSSAMEGNQPAVVQLLSDFGGNCPLLR